MVTPTTWLSGLLLLCFAGICFSFWPNAFKLAGNRWRFELFSFDFGIAALLTGVIAAYTLGSMGSDLGFSERLMVSSRTNQAFAVLAGGIFAFGNMLLLCGVALLGLSIAFPLAVGTALVIYSFMQFGSANLMFLLLGMVCLLVAMILSAAAARQGEKTLPGASLVLPVRKQASSSRKYVVKKPPESMLSSTKGLLVCIVSGIALGVFFPFLQRSLAGDFGLGTYAGLILFGIGILASTIVLNFYFMNIAIHGGSISLDAYFQGKPNQHFLGFAAGAIWALGALTMLLALSVLSQVQVDISLTWEIVLPLASVVLAALCGLMVWKEHSGAKGPVRRNVLLAILFFIAGLGIFAFSISHSRTTPAASVSAGIL